MVMNILGMDRGIEGQWVLYCIVLYLSISIALLTA